MKITRLQRGYSIRLSDSEFAALNDIVARGLGEYEGMSKSDWAAIDPIVKRGLNGTWFNAGCMAVEDRRK